MSVSGSRSSNTLWSTKFSWTFSSLLQTNPERWEIPTTPPQLLICCFLIYRPRACRISSEKNCFLWSEQEMIESIRESVVYMAHTHDGARVAMNCLWHGAAKVFAHTHPVLLSVSPSNLLLFILLFDTLPLTFSSSSVSFPLTFSSPCPMSLSRTSISS